LTRDLKIAKLTDAIEKSEVALVDLRMKVLLGHLSVFFVLFFVTYLSF